MHNLDVTRVVIIGFCGQRSTISNWILVDSASCAFSQKLRLDIVNGQLYVVSNMNVAISLKKEDDTVANM